MCRLLNKGLVVLAFVLTVGGAEAVFAQQNAATPVGKESQPVAPAPAATEQGAVSGEPAKITLGHFDEQQRRIRWLENEKKLTKLRRELQEENSDKSSVAAPPSIAGGSHMPPMMQGGQFPPLFPPDGLLGESEVLPVIIAIQGMDPVYEATLQDERGGIYTVKSGSALPDGSKVVNVAPSGVTIRKKGKLKSLPLSGAITGAMQGGE